MKRIIFAGLSVLAVVLSGCGGAMEETPTPEMEIDFAPVVSISGEVTPQVRATVSVQTSGAVLEVLVEPGDVVAEGDLLLRLDSTDAELAVRRAEAALEAAQARLSLRQAGPRREEIAIAEDQIAVAEAALDRAIARQEQLLAGAIDAEIASAQAQVTAAQAEQLTARENHDQTMECYEFTSPDGTKRQVCPLLGPVEEQARYHLRVAREELDVAQAQLEASVGGANDRILAAEAAVSAAEAQRDIAQAQAELLKAGAKAKEIASAEAALAQAQAALDSAQLRLERCDLRAPIAGTVGLVRVQTGEFVAPGQPLVTIGDLDTLWVETTDLNEIDVGQVAVGQEASITFDSLPERTFGGRVIRISPKAESDTGGVNYATVIEVDDVAPAIRWGMTAFVDIERVEE